MDQLRQQWVHATTDITIQSLTQDPGMIPPTIYYGRVVSELGKMAVQGRNMAPP